MKNTEYDGTRKKEKERSEAVFEHTVRWLQQLYKTTQKTPALAYLTDELLLKCEQVGLLTSSTGQVCIILTVYLYTLLF